MSNDLHSHRDSASNISSHSEIIRAFNKVFGKLMSYATADWINVDLSMAQIKMIFTLHYNGAYSLNRLAERLTIGAPTASHLVEKLVQAGLAVRLDSTTDRRVIEVSLTDDGHAMADRLWGARNQIIGHWVSQLSPEAQQTLGESLQALLAIIDKNANSGDNRPIG